MEIGSVIICKLVDGTDVMGKVSKKPGDSIILENPVKFYDIYLETGAIAQSLTTYNKFAKNNLLTLSQSHIVTIQEPLDSVIVYYQSFIDYMLITEFIKESVDLDTKIASEQYKSLINKYLDNKKENEFMIQKYTEGIETGSFNDIILYNMSSPSKFLN